MVVTARFGGQPLGTGQLWGPRISESFIYLEHWFPCGTYPFGSPSVVSVFEKVIFALWVVIFD
jgi:hypothetical protein